jgi:hypothetical protein
MLLTLALALPGLLLVTPAAAKLSPPAQWIRGIYVASPAPDVIPRSLAWQRAEALARLRPGATVLHGSGASMEPYYPSGTLLVVAPAPFTELTRGQTVIYHNRQGRPVAHVLVARCPDGWRVAGLNNPRPDADGVRADNLLGVVIAAITPAPDQRVAALTR